MAAEAKTFAAAPLVVSTARAATVGDVERLAGVAAGILALSAAARAAGRWPASRRPAARRSSPRSA